MGRPTTNRTESDLGDIGDPERALARARTTAQPLDESVRVPARHVVAMLARILVEFFVGSIPVLRTLVDAGWKINVRNVAVMEAHVVDTE